MRCGAEVGVVFDRDTGLYNGCVERLPDAAWSSLMHWWEARERPEVPANDLATSWRRRLRCVNSINRL